jgi:hypothetical protein
MTRRESLAALAVAFTLIAAGLVWLLGPYGLLVAGGSLAAVALFTDHQEERRAEPVPEPGTSPWAGSGP